MTKVNLTRSKINHLLSLVLLLVVCLISTAQTQDQHAGNAELKKGEYENAIRLFNSRLTNNATDVEAQRNLLQALIDTGRYVDAESSAKKFLLKQMHALQLSARSYTRILKVARTIADLANSAVTELHHVAEALHYRSLDKPLVIPTINFTRLNTHHIG